MKKLFFALIMMCASLVTDAQTYSRYDVNHDGTVSVADLSVLASYILGNINYPVTDITLSKTNATLTVGVTLQLSATVLPKDADDPSLVWSSSNSNVATVSSTGLVTAVAAGQCEITATAKDGSKVTASCAITVKSATSGDQEHPNNPSVTSVTGGVSGITAISATMQGYANNVTLGGNIYAGICYSTTNTTPTVNDQTLTKTSVGSDKSYSVVAKKLSPETTYYYRAYVYRGGLVQYAASTYSFSTPSTDGIVTTGEATNITSVTAIVASNYNLPSTAYSSITRGVCYSTSNATPTTSDNKVTASSSSNGNYSVSLTGLNNNTLYYYRSYIIVDGQTIYGKVCSFSTEGVPIAPTIAVTGAVESTVKSSSIDVTCTANIGNIDFNTIQLGVCWSATNSDPTVNDNTVTTQEMDADSKYTLKLTNLKDNTTYYYRAFIRTDKDIYYGTVMNFNVEPFPHEFVDLGLSVKWATCNVGAWKPEDYGLYFAWGETTGYTQDTNDGRQFNWANYKWCNSSFSTMTKYCASSSDGTVDNKTILDPEDDAAHVNWGGSWRMPTRAEQDELLTKCTWTWTIQNGVKGYKVTSKSNGNSIFLPAAGYRYYDSLNNAGSIGYYWSSSLVISRSDYAYYLYFDSSYVGWGVNYRNSGLSVRPVCQ